MRLGRATRQVTSLTGEGAGFIYPAIAAGLSTGTLSYETAALIVSKLDRLDPEVSPIDKFAAELNLVVTATGGSITEHVLASLADGDMTASSDTVLLHQLLSSNENLPEHFNNIKIMTDVWCQTLDQDGKEPLDDTLSKAKTAWC